MKQIKLYSRNPWSPKLFALVDDEDYDLLNRYTWYQFTNSSGIIYARIYINNKPILMHQLVLPSPSKDLTPDHINRNGLDNQKLNLRLATKSQQAANSVFAGFNKLSQYRGVSYSKSKKKWRAYIKVNGINQHLGYFITEKEAAESYNKEAFKSFGEFAKLNEF